MYSIVGFGDVQKDSCKGAFVVSKANIGFRLEKPGASSFTDFANLVENRDGPEVR